MTVSGFLLVNKPEGITSFDVVARARRLLGERSIGHLGTLDPLATGLLVLAVGEGTKLVEYFNGLDKVYEAQFTLGQTSTTYDREGVVTQVEGAVFPLREAVEEALHGFVGVIQQVPPAYSAIKIKGERAYVRARRGETVEIPAREVMVHSISILGYEPPHVMLRIYCGSGTYVRSIAHDLGQKLGCGALMSDLVRTRVGSFSLERAVPLSDDLASALLPLEKVVEGWPAFNLDDRQFQALRHGQTFSAPPLFPRAAQAHPVAGFYRGVLVALLALEAFHFVRALKNLHPSDGVLT